MRTGGEILQVTALIVLTRTSAGTPSSLCLSAVNNWVGKNSYHVVVWVLRGGFLLIPMCYRGLPSTYDCYSPNKTSIRMSRTYNLGVDLCCHGVYHLVRMLEGLGSLLNTAPKLNICLIFMSINNKKWNDSCGQPNPLAAHSTLNPQQSLVLNDITHRIFLWREEAEGGCVSHNAACQ